MDYVRVPPLGVELHRVDRVERQRLGPPGEVTAQRLLVPARPHPRERHHVGVGVGLDQLAVAAAPPGAVEVELPEPDREQLHELPGKVLVGQPALKVEIGHTIGSQAPISIPLYAWPQSRARRTAGGMTQG